MATLTDEQLTQDVRDEFAFDPMVDAANLVVTVTAGQVTLIGTAKNDGAKWEAERAARSVRGVRSVTNEIVVAPDAPVFQDDTAIVSAILTTFRYDSMVPQNKISIDVVGGNVTLTGVVDWYFQEVTAVADARKVPGVRSVTDAITVAPQWVSAAEIRRQINDALARNAGVHDDTVSVMVEGSHVALSGGVHSLFERDIVLQVVWRARGVTDVTNNLIVLP